MLKTVLKVEFDHTAITLDQIRAAVTDTVGKIADDIQTEAIRRIVDGPKTGKVYRVKTGERMQNRANGRFAKGFHRVGNDYKMHTASAAGEAPANLSGDLAGSITVEDVNFGKAVVVGEDYGQILEEKRDRAFLGPAFDVVVNQADVILENFVNARVTA